MHYPRAQSQGHHTIDRLEERDVEIEIARRSTLTGQEKHKNTRKKKKKKREKKRKEDTGHCQSIYIATVKAASWKEFSERRCSAYGVFRPLRYHFELV